MSTLGVAVFYVMASQYSHYLASPGKMDYFCISIDRNMSGEFDISGE